jgi:putative ABC transport system substrate-binding protein
VRRREFITLVGGAAAWPLVARAQQPAMPSVGVLMGPANDASGQAQAQAFAKGLGDSGFIEGRNVAIEYRWAGGRSDLLQELAVDLVRRKVAVIATMSNNAAVAAKAATSTIPIVFSVGGDPVKMGLVASLNRPAGNITGVSFLSTGTAAKRLELLHEMAPNATVVAALINPANLSSDTEMSEMQEAAHVLGFELHTLKASSEQDIDMAFTTLVKERVEALLIQGDSFFNARRRQLAALTLRHAIPAVGQAPDNVDAGILMSYGTSLSDAFRVVGVYVGRILKGEKPADLPIQQSSRFELVINLTTAKALGLTVPPNLLAIADEVIE